MTEGAQYKHFAEVLQCIKGKRLLKIHRAIRALASALDPLLGRRIIRILSVGKEIFFVFEQLGRPGQEDLALKIHFGDGPGYQYESRKGEVWGMVTRPSKRQPIAETELEFEGCRFRLWEDHNFYSHLYEVVDFGYVHAVEARRHRDIATETMSKCTDEVVTMLQRKDGYIVDLIMDQTIMPGVGNIMKSEGLFKACTHPLRKCRSLSTAELRRIVDELNRFALMWYNLCKRSGEGAPPSRSQAKGQHSEEMLPKECYGQMDCSRCGEEIYCIKLGSRRRVTYFCNACQPPVDAPQPFRRKHKLQIPLQLPLCKCRRPTRIMHVFRYGRDHGRVFFACRKMQFHSTTCNFRRFLDDTEFRPPMCHCQPPQRTVLRRVMGLVDNGRYFARCASKRCKLRVWLMPTAAEWLRDDGSTPPAPGTDVKNDETEPADEKMEQRWNRHRRFELARGRNGTHNPTQMFVQRCATGEFVHGRIGIAQIGKHLLGVPNTKGVVQAAGYPAPAEDLGSKSCTPVTSEAEELLEDVFEKLPRPPGQPPVYEKRWRRVLTRTTFERNSGWASIQDPNSSNSDAPSHSYLAELFPSVSPRLIDDMVNGGAAVEDIVDCLSVPESQRYYA